MVQRKDEVKNSLKVIYNKSINNQKLKADNNFIHQYCDKNADECVDEIRKHNGKKIRKELPIKVSKTGVEKMKVNNSFNTTKSNMFLTNTKYNLLTTQDNKLESNSISQFNQLRNDNQKKMTGLFITTGLQSTVDTVHSERLLSVPDNKKRISFLEPCSDQKSYFFKDVVLSEDLKKRKSSIKIIQTNGSEIVNENTDNNELKISAYKSKLLI